MKSEVKGYGSIGVCFYNRLKSVFNILEKRIILFGRIFLKEFIIIV